MCEFCGCTTYIKAGKQAILGRSQEIVNSLRLTPKNIELFEDCERISFEVVGHSSPTLEGDDVLDICKWVHSLHEPIYKERFPKYLDAAKDVFSRLPSEGDTKEAITAYHQLEQLAKNISGAELESMKDQNVKDALRAVRNVHNNNAEKKAKLNERYSLE